VQVVVAKAAKTTWTRPAAVDPVAAAVGDPAQLLDVDVQQLARPLADIADRDAGRTVLVSQPGQPVAGQDVADGRARHADDGRQPVRAEAVLVPGSEDRVHLHLGQGSWRAERPGAPVLEARLTLRFVSPEPLPGGLAAHPEHIGGMRDGHPVDQDPIHQELSAERRQLRSTMCHESLPSVVSWTPTPSLGRLSSVNNLFGNHT